MCLFYLLLSIFIYINIECKKHSRLTLKNPLLFYFSVSHYFNDSPFLKNFLIVKSLILLIITLHSFVNEHKTYLNIEKHSVNIVIRYFLCMV